MGQIREGPGVDRAVFPGGRAQEETAMGNLARRRLGQNFGDIHDAYNRHFSLALQGVFDKYT
jgi:hypothetical protein